MASIYSTSSIPQGIPIYANATLFPPVAQDGEQAVAADTNTLYIYDSSVPGWQPVANPGAAIAIDALTGEVTATGPGVVAATITNAAVTNAKLAAMADNTVKGNKSGLPASPSDLALSDVTESVSNVLTISNGSKSVVSAANLTIQVLQSSAMQDGYLSSTDWSTFNSKQPSGNYITDLTGEVTATGPGSVAATIAANAVTNAKLAKMATNTIKGNNTAGPSDPLDLTTAQTTAMLDVMVGDSGAGGTKGLVPAPVTGDATKYLRGDATWQTISLLPAYSQDKVLYSTASAAEWRTVGLGSTDSTYPTGCVILGTTKPSGLTGSGAQNSLIVGATAGAALTSATPVTLLNGGSALTSGINNVLIGANSNSITTGYKNVIIGASTLFGNLPATTYESVIIGDGAWAANADQSVTIGYGTQVTAYSVAIGRAAKAGDVNYGAQRNVAIGFNALLYQGSDGVVIGYTANGRGPSQIAIGSGAAAGDGGVGGTTAAKNIVIGKGSGYYLCTGNNNTVLGTESFNSASLTTAANNTIIGQGSATALTVGSNNCILGQGLASALTSGTHNIVIGVESLNAATSSTYCTAIGYQAAQTNNTGNRVIAIGYQAGQSVNNATDAICIGTLAGANGSGKNGSISIGYNAGHNSANEAICIGRYAGYASGGGGSYGVAIGTEALNYANGSYSIGIGYWAGRGAASSNSVFIGKWAGQASVANDEFYLGNQNYANNAAEKTNSLMYGTFNATAASQTLSLNAQVNLAYGEKHASVHAQTGTANVITATVNNYYIGVDSTLAAKTVNLPAAATAGQGFVLVIKDEAGTAATNNIVVDANASETIDGATTQTIAANYGSLSLMCSGSAWFIM